MHWVKNGEPQQGPVVLKSSTPGPKPVLSGSFELTPYWDTEAEILQISQLKRNEGVTVAGYVQPWIELMTLEKERQIKCQPGCLATRQTGSQAFHHGWRGPRTERHS